MSSTEIVGVSLIALGFSCFLFCLARFEFFANKLGKALVKIGWDERSLNAPSVLILLLFPLTIIGLGAWLINTNYTEQIGKLQKEVAEIKIRESSVWKMLEELKHVDQVYHLAFQGSPPDGFDPANIKLEASVKKRGGHEFRIYDASPQVEIAPSGLLVTIPKLNPGDQLFMVMKMNDGQEWKTPTLQVPATPALLQKVSRSR